MATKCRHCKRELPEENFFYRGKGHKTCFSCYKLNSKPINKCEICFWDSYAYKPPKEVNNLMLKIKKQAKQINKDMKIKITKNLIFNRYK